MIIFLLKKAKIFYKFCYTINNMNFIQEQLEKQRNKNNKFHNGKKQPKKLAKPSKNFKPMRAK